MTRRLNQVQPTSLREAMKLCLDYAREKHNRSVERVSDLMGLKSHWQIYKWQENGRLPSVLIRPFESACGADYVTSFLTHSAGKLAIDIPSGRSASLDDLNQLQAIFSDAFGLLVRFYDQDTGPEEAVSALVTVMENLGWHLSNIPKHDFPELDFKETAR
ncbi:MAG: hypothetical protein KZQ89_01535 [Candidatus Thiodiazotropha sp. (ex Lucinoma kastoroae)]|nr:hypothetical protein [Candidatus Thiodiazotropha sp. (ex Lucinoma kastoroae)]